MKRFLALIYVALVLFTFLDLEGKSQNNDGHQKKIPEDKCIYTSGSLGLFINATEEESTTALNKRQLPDFQKLPFNSQQIERISEQNIQTDLSAYIYYSAFHINRFEGPDIIQPFHSFW